MSTEFIVLDDLNTPQCPRMTIGDYASVQLDLSHLPEFAFTPHGPRYLSRTALCATCDQPIHEKRGERKHFYAGDYGPMCIDCADAHNLPQHGPMLPAKRLTKVMRRGREAWVEIAPRTHEQTHKADPKWGTAFTTKFSKTPEDQPELVTPRGAQPPMPKGLSRIEEIEFLANTQHLDLATDMATFEANGIDARSIRAANDEEMQIAEQDVRRTPFAVLIGYDDIEYKGSIIKLPRYGDLRYIAAMSRRIEWEQWSDACYRQPMIRAFFEPTPDGRTGIEAIAKRADADQVLAARKRVKELWLEGHDELPDPTQISRTAQSVRDLMTPDQDLAYRQSITFGNEDPDPGRDAHHADPDPKPARDQYAFGYCTHMCADLDAPAELQTHVGCTTDGWQLFKLDLDMWAARQTDRGYAGPDGYIAMYKPNEASRIPGSEFAEDGDA